MSVCTGIKITTLLQHVPPSAVRLALGDVLPCWNGVLNDPFRGFISLGHTTQRLVQFAFIVPTATGAAVLRLLVTHRGGTTMKLLPCPLGPHNSTGRWSVSQR